MISSGFLLSKSLTNNVCKSCVRNLRNPGMNRRLKILSSPAEKLEDVDDLDLDDLETDFFQVHKSQKEHTREFDAMKEQEKFHIVRQKYFKQKLPNFLTWHDKEQIRHLHRTDPEEWTTEKLSEAFPALPDVIAKIVKSNWTKNNQNRISNHDHYVQENWKLFKEGKLSELPDELKEHLKKFTNRALIFTPFSIPQGDTNLVKTRRRLDCTEFSDIISDYERLKAKNKTEFPDGDMNEFRNSKSKDEKSFNKNNKDISTTVEANKQQSDTYYDKKGLKRIGNPVTLDVLKTKVENLVSAGKRVSESDRMLMNQLDETNINSKPVELKPEDIKDITVKKFNAVSRSYQNPRDHRDISHLVYPERIRIPSKLRKRGSTYKLNDCYYGSDGWFLYRVPGMVN